MDSSLRFAHHAEQLSLKAFRALGFVMRTSRHFRSLLAVIHLYETLVLSQLDYCSTIWSPFYENHCEVLERIQRRFTRFVFRKFGFSYAEYGARCHVLDLLPLKKRRLLHDQMVLFSVVRSTITVNPANSNIFIRTDRNTRSRDLFLEKTWRLNTSFNAPFPRMLRVHNRYFSSLDIFHLSRKKYKELATDILWDLTL